MKKDNNNIPAEGYKISAIIFQDGETVTKDEIGKEISLIHSGVIDPANPKKAMGNFLNGLLRAYFQPVAVVSTNGVTIYKPAKIANLKDIKVSFTFEGLPLGTPIGKSTLQGCIGKGLPSLKFASLGFKLLALISEVTTDENLLNTIAAAHKAAGKTDADIAALKAEAKIEIAKSGVRFANVAIRSLRKDVAEHSQYGVYVSEKRKELAAAKKEGKTEKLIAALNEYTAKK